MPTYRYRAMTSSGTIVSGVLEAPSEPAAIQAIRNLGHYPIAANDDVSARPHRDFAGIFTQDIFRRRISRRSLAIATQELAALLKAGLELDRALVILGNLDETKSLRAPLASVLAQIRNGAGLADALAAETVFPKFYVNMVRAGEQGGHLERALEQLGEYLTRAHAVREAVTSALVYPAVLLVTAGLAIIVVLVFVLPQFEPLFADAGKTLPLSTRIVMGMGRFLVGWGWLVLGALIATAVMFGQALKRKEFRRRWDGFLLRLPLIGQLIQKVEVERFARILGSLAANAVPLPQALTVTADTLGNSVIAEAVHGASAAVREGDRLGRYLASTGVFPSLALDMVRVGEETAQLDAMLLRQADLYERDVRHTIDRLVALLVPCLTIFMGLIVAGLISSILMAVLSVNDLAM
ncbi:MAG TPA: type II secretion system F family protein [Rhizomicrobium sp.]